ncbi:MAG: carbohydrate ABC transporter permease [Candidatus Goldiibacteriota bacterium]
MKRKNKRKPGGIKKKTVYREEQNLLFPSFEMKDPGVRMIHTLWGAVVVLGALLTSIPFIWMIISAMMPVEYVFEPLGAVLGNLSFETKYFRQAWETAPFIRYFLNSLIVAGCVVAGQIVISAMAAFSLSKLKPPLTGVIMILFLSTIMIPFETIAIPLYLFMRDFSVLDLFELNLVSTYWALILPGLANAFNIFILKSYFDKLPDDFIEAARVDGSSETSIFFRIIMPITSGIIGVLAVLNFVTIWNSFFWPLIVVNEPDMYTMMLGIYKIIEEGYPWNVVMAAVAISMAPTILIFVIFQRKLMRGVVFTTLQE